MPKEKIYTNKKEFDKANKMYNDSLALYNQGENAPGKLLKKGFVLDNNEWNNFSDKVKINDKTIKVKDKIGSDYLILDKSETGNNNINSSIKPIKVTQYTRKAENRPILGDDYGSMFASGDDYWTTPKYKKPTTKPIYQPDVKPTETVKPKVIPQNQRKPIQPVILEDNPKLNKIQSLPLSTIPVNNKTNIQIPTQQVTKPTTKAVDVRTYTAGKYLKSQGKSSGYINEGDGTGRKEVYANGGWLDFFKPPTSRIEAETKLDALNNRSTAEKWLDASKPIMKEANNTSEIYQSGVNKGKPTGKGALEPSYPEMMLMPGSLPIKAASKLGKAAVFAAEALNPIGGIKNLKSNLINKPTSSVVENTAKQLSNSNNIASVINSIPNSWSMQELPGLHLKSTMTDGAISKIIEPKTGLINTEQALGIIGKESGGADKVALIKQGLGETISKKMDYNEFRKVVQDQLIPLERQFATNKSNYGIDRLGYNYGTVEENIGGTFNIYGNPTKFKTRQEAEEFLKLNSPIENQTLILGNKNKFGRGSSAHGNPDETLGHIHFLRDAETPDVLTITQIQSDAFQGTHRIMPKNAPDVSKIEKSLQRMQELQETNKSVLNKMKTEGVDEAGLPVQQYQIKQFEDIVKAQEQSNLFKKAEIENFTQKQLLDKNHQERYLQELVDYAGKRGDVNKVRVPTSETAAKVQGYSPIQESTLGPKTKKQLDESSTFEDFFALKKDEIGDYKLNNEEFNAIKKIYTDYKTGNLGKVYDPAHTTILKKYSEQPKTIKKLFGVEPKVVTDSKGNTWYEFDIPKKYKEGKAEIKALTTVGAVLGGAALQNKKSKGGWLDNQ
jgi:hypothetical protein